MARTILLADDSVTIQRVVGQIFEPTGFEVAGFTNGEEALEQAGRLAPDLVIADVHMPGASGYDVARAIKDRSPETPVLLLVGTFEPFDQGRLEASGADGHLMKPFDEQELLRRVEDLVPDARQRGSESADSSPQQAVEEPTGDAPEEVTSATDVQPVDAPAAETVGPQTSMAEVAEPEARDDQQPSGARSAEVAPTGLSDADVDRVARRVVELMSEELVSHIAHEVVPELAQVAIARRIEELEQEAE